MERGSYLLIQIGMTISGPDGSLGSVQDIVADPASDVFRGIVIGTGLLSRHLVFIPGDDVVSVDEDGVTVRIRKEDVDQLPRYNPQDPAHAGKVN